LKPEDKSESKAKIKEKKNIDDILMPKNKLNQEKYAYMNINMEK